MTRILFICHGNICRSAMAEYMMKDMAAKAGRSGEFFVDSAAVSREEIGNGVYPPARRELQKHGIACDGHHAKQVTRADLEKFDRLYYMDESNAWYLKRLLPESPKIRKLLDRDVEDPWYTGDFAGVYRDLEEGCRKILEEF